MRSAWFTSTTLILAALGAIVADMLLAQASYLLYADQAHEAKHTIGLLSDNILGLLFFTPTLFSCIGLHAHLAIMHQG